MNLILPTDRYNHQILWIPRNLLMQVHPLITVTTIAIINVHINIEMEDYMLIHKIPQGVCQKSQSQGSLIQ